MNIIVKTIFGSHLYGTNIPSSDIDYKIIYQDSIEDIILSRNKEIVRDTSRDCNEETEYIELRKYLKDLVGGQTYAIDMLFTPRDMVLQTSNIWNEIRQNKNKLLSKDCKAFIGYCDTQASVYSNKGKDIRLLNEILVILDNHNGTTKLIEIKDELSMHMKLVRKDFQRNGKVISELFFELIGKYFSTTMIVKDFKKRAQEKLNSYGKRAKEAAYDLKDWKAIYHAFRCIWELKELAQTGQIHFPLKYRDNLLLIRKGKWVDYKPERLTWEVQGAKTDVRYSPHLKSEVDKEWVNKFILDCYLL